MEGQAGAGAQLKSEAGAITWLELITPDPKKATAFLTTVLGIKTEKAPGPMDYTLAKVDGKDAFGIMALTRKMAAMHVPPHWMPYFEVASCEASAKKAASLGER
jgi:predicted enzyme related to lactoylglutathione lyase